MDCCNLNNYDESYDKAYKIISETQKKCKTNKYSYPVSNITGPTGPTGPSGMDGITPTFAIGTVTTGEPGTNAAVTITEV